MTVTQRVVSIADFARARREAGGQFAERVEQFESRFGPVDDDRLAVLAQAAYLCWNNVQAESNLFALCEAISRGKPTSQYYHCQITPDRWNEMHAYLVGVQRWLGLEDPVPPQIDAQKVEQVGKWLGERAPAKEALAKLLLIRLVDDLLSYMSLARLGCVPDPDAAEYSDFSAWYFAPDGTPYAVPRSGDDRRPFAEPPFKARAEELARLVRENMATAPDDAEGLVGQMMRQTQPPCMHRFSRYLDVQITSIGALKWRGNLPPDRVPKAAWQAFHEQAKEALEAWGDGLPPDGELAKRLHASLGEPTEQKQAMIHDFLFAGFWDEGDGAGWHWLVPRAQTEGTNACSLFGLHGRFGGDPVPDQSDAGDSQ